MRIAVNNGEVRVRSDFAISRSANAAWAELTELTKGLLAVLSVGVGGCLGEYALQLWILG